MAQNSNRRYRPLILALSNEVNRIQNLKHLSIFNNSIRELPHLKQSSLETLNCANNKLDCIPAGISTSKLRILDFSINRIKDVPRGVCSVTSLRCLYLSDNDLVTIPSQIGALELLEILSLRDNKITFIPPTIGRLSRLNTLLLQGNKLQFVPKELGSFSRFLFAKTLKLRKIELTRYFFGLLQRRVV